MKWIILVCLLFVPLVSEGEEELCRHKPVQMTLEYICPDCEIERVIGRNPNLAVDINPNDVYYELKLLKARIEKLEERSITISPFNEPDFCPICNYGSVHSVWDKDLKAMKCPNCNGYWSEPKNLK